MKRYRPRGERGETPAAEQRQGVPGKGNRAAELAEMQWRGGGPNPLLPSHLQARGRSGVDWRRWGREASGDAVQQRESADASSSAEVEPLLDARQLTRAQRLNPRGQERRGWQPEQLDAAGLEVASTAFALRIAHFQRERGLVVDGIVGPETLGAAGVAPAAGRAPAGAATTATDAASSTTAPAAASAATPMTPTTAPAATSATTPTTPAAAASTKPANTADDQLWLAVATYELGDTRLGRAHWEAYLQQLGADHWRRVLELDGLGVDGWVERANALEELEGGPPPPVSAAEKARREAASRLELLFTTRDRANKLTHELRGRLTADLRRRVLGPDTKMIRAGLYLGMQSAAVSTGVEEVLAAADETVGAVCALLAEVYALHCKSAELEQLRAQTVHSLEILRAHGLTGQLPGAFPRQRSGPTPELGDRPGDANVRPNRRAPSRSSELGDQAGDAIIIHEGPAAERIDVAALGLDPSAPESYDTYRARGLAAYGAGNDELAAAYGLLMDRAAARERGESARAPVQRRSNAIAAEDVQAAAAEGIATPAQSLPHLERLQPAFQGHDLTTIAAHVGSDAARSANAMGAEAYATGEHIVFANTPDLETTAHEVTHVLQQRQGVQLRSGIGQVGDPYEREADAVAANIVQGRSAALTASAPSAVPGTIQRRSWEMDIKTDLYVAMSGWGTNEDAIYRRLSHATLPELRQVLADSKLMAELRSTLSASELPRVLDLLNAPLAGGSDEQNALSESATTASSVQRKQATTGHASVTAAQTLLRAAARDAGDGLADPDISSALHAALRLHQAAEAVALLPHDVVSRLYVIADLAISRATWLEAHWRVHQPSAAKDLQAAIHAISGALEPSGWKPSNIAPDKEPRSLRGRGGEKSVFKRDDSVLRTSFAAVRETLHAPASATKTHLGSLAAQAIPHLRTVLETLQLPEYAAPARRVAWTAELQRTTAAIDAYAQLLRASNHGRNDAISELFAAERRIHTTIGLTTGDLEERRWLSIRSTNAANTTNDILDAASGGDGPTEYATKMGAVDAIQATILAFVDMKRTALEELQVALDEPAPPKERNTLDIVAEIFVNILLSATTGYLGGLIGTQLGRAFQAAGSVAALPVRYQQANELIAAMNQAVKPPATTNDAVKKVFQDLYSNSAKAALNTKAAARDGAASETNAPNAHAMGLVRTPKNVFLSIQRQKLDQMHLSMHLRMLGLRETLLLDLDLQTLNAIVQELSSIKDDVMAAGLAGDVATTWLNFKAQLAHGSKDDQNPQRGINIPEGLAPGHYHGHAHGVLLIDFGYRDNRLIPRRMSLGGAEPSIHEYIRSQESVANLPINRVYTVEGPVALSTYEGPVRAPVLGLQRKITILQRPDGSITVQSNSSGDNLLVAIGLGISEQEATRYRNSEPTAPLAGARTITSVAGALSPKDIQQ